MFLHAQCSSGACRSRGCLSLFAACLANESLGFKGGVFALLSVRSSVLVSLSNWPFRSTCFVTVAELRLIPSCSLFTITHSKSTHILLLSEYKRAVMCIEKIIRKIRTPVLYRFPPQFPNNPRPKSKPLLHALSCYPFPIKKFTVVVA